MAAHPGPGEPYLFVSYASGDRERVLHIVDALRARGIAVWLDQQGIAGGANYGAEIAAHRLLGELDTDAGWYDDAERNLTPSPSRMPAPRPSSGH